MLIELFRVQDNVAAEIARIHAELEAAAARIPEAETGVEQAQISFAGNLKGLGQTTRFGDLLTLVNRPQEVVAALQQLATAYDNYFSAVNDFNRAQFRLYHALGYPADIVACRQPLGEIHAGRHQPAPAAAAGPQLIAVHCTSRFAAQVRRRSAAGIGLIRPAGTTWSDRKGIV